MGAVSAGLLEAANLRTGLMAGLEMMEVMARGAQEPIWADEPMTFTGTDGELGPNMTLGGLRGATMFRVAAQIETTVQPGRVKMLNDLYRRLGIADQRGIHDSAKRIMSPRTGRALSGSTMQAVAEYLGHLEMAMDLVDYALQSQTRRGYRVELGADGPSLAWYRGSDKRSMSKGYLEGLQHEGLGGAMLVGFDGFPMDESTFEGPTDQHVGYFEYQSSKGGLDRPMIDETGSEILTHREYRRYFKQTQDLEERMEQDAGTGNGNCAFGTGGGLTKKKKRIRSKKNKNPPGPTEDPGRATGGH